MNKKVSDSATRLNELMREYGLTQADLSKRTGLNKSVVSLYANGKRDPRQDNLALISETFGIDPTWLMGFDVPMKKEKMNTDNAAILGQTFKDSIAWEVTKLMSQMNDEQKGTLLQYAKFLLSQSGINGSN